jgi:CRISPR-associated endonuclease/helicase Cas3
MNAWTRWSAKLGRDRVSLFHSRFTVDDREAIEHEIVRRFGFRSGPTEREGRLVIATQVAEQSLDLDFDTMVTDLAPVDLLIQRAGRLRRHRRDEAGQRIEHDGPDRRGRTVLHVHSPVPVADCGVEWFRSFLPGAAVVYPDHGALWLTARWLSDRGRLRAPDDLREVIEHVYGEEAIDMAPPELQDSMFAVRGRDHANKSVADSNAIDFLAGYCPSGGLSSWRSDVATPTRLGEPTSTVRLARVVADSTRPWHDEQAYPWDRSQVSVRRSLVAAESRLDSVVLERIKAQMPDEGKFTVVVLMREAEGQWSGRAEDGRGNPVRISYGSRSGLIVQSTS